MKWLVISYLASSYDKNPGFCCFSKKHGGKCQPWTKERGRIGVQHRSGAPAWLPLPSLFEMGCVLGLLDLSREKISGLVAHIGSRRWGCAEAKWWGMELIPPISLTSGLGPHSCSPPHIPGCTRRLRFGGQPASAHLSFPVLNKAALFFPRSSVSTQHGTFWSWSLIKVLFVFHGNWRC